MQTSNNVWTENVQGKLDEIRTLLLLYLASRDDRTAKEIKQKLEFLRMMFADQSVPPTLTRLSEALEGVRTRSSDPQAVLNLFRFHDELISVGSFGVDDRPFDRIFESYKSDKTLNTLIDELVELLQRVLSEGNEVLTAQIARELETILAQIKKRNQMSLVEMLVWVEFCLPALLMIFAAHQNVPELLIVAQAVKKAFKLKERLMELYKDAKEQLIAERKLTYVQKAISHPEITSDENARKLLSSAPEQPSNP
jgi:hypothetical protein